MKKIILLVCILSILITPNISSAKDSTEYKVVGDKQFPPYEYVDNDGNFKGFNVDMMKAISLVSGMEFEFIPMKWDDAYHAIDNGTADIIQGMKESGLRREKFLFSESLLVNSQSIFVLAENKSIYGIRDLKDKKVAINIQDMNYNDSNNFGNIDAIEYESLSDALNALLNEEVDALIGNTLTINYLCKENNSIDKVQIVGEAINESKYSIAVGKNRGDLLDKLDKAILELQKNGMYDSIYRKWFGTPIKNTRIANEGLLKAIAVICVALIVGMLGFFKINESLNKIIAEKTEEHKLLINELRNYDKMQFMDKIISSIAHEIRNPMTSIKLYVNQMNTKIENKEFMLAASKDISEEVERIEGLISEFVEYSSPRKANIENLNLKEELNNALSFVKLQIRGARLNISVKENTYIKFDKSHFRQVILNILLNSVDAVKDIASPYISIYEVEDEKSVILKVVDNGYGMEAENLEYIFEPFFTTKDYGNGVGMFVVKQIIEENGGDIKVESNGENCGMKIEIKMERGGDLE